MTDILLSALLLSVVLVGIHSFFGIEIIRRQIIFTDLAIGQMAALGAAVSLLLFDGRNMYLISLMFAISSALCIAHFSKLSQYPEAVIGLLYAFSLSAVFIVLSQTHRGLEEFHRLMASDILFTPLPSILETAVMYAIIGIVLAAGYKYIKHPVIKNMMFFITFAITVTSSVKLAGVLIVFALLLSPAMIALSLRAQHPLIVAWIAGTVINIFSIYLSYTLDLPTGYTLVAVHSFSAVAICAIRLKK